MLKSRRDRDEYDQLSEMETVPLDPCPLSLEVERDLDERGLSLRLPVRDLDGDKGKVGVGLLVFGLIGTLFMTFWMHPWSWWSEIGREGWGGSDWFGFAFSMLGLPGLAIALGLLLGGLFLLTGSSQATVGLTEEHLLYRERLGLLRWTWKRRRRELRSLTVGTTLSTENGKSWGGILSRGQGKAMPIAAGYSDDVLRGVAWELGKHLRGVETLSQVRPETLQRSGREADSSDLAEPRETTVSKHRRLEGIELAVAPAGIRKGAHGLLPMAIFWNVFMAIFILVFLFASDDSDGAAIFWVFIAFFQAIGIFLAAHSVEMGTRSAEISAVAGRLQVVRKSLLRGRREESWSRDELIEIRVGSSGTTVNDHELNELQIIRADGKKVLGILSQCQDEELRWVRALLVQALWPEG